MCLPLFAFAEPFGTWSGYSQIRTDNNRGAVEFGIGGSSQLSDWVDVRGIASYVGDGVDDRARVNIGLADIHHPSGAVGVRLGRMQHQFGYWTSALNWAPARDLHLAPQGIYREGFEYMQRTGDGAAVYAQHKFDAASVRVEASYTKPMLYRMEDITATWNGVGGEVHSDSARVAGFSIEVEVPALASSFRYDNQHLYYHMDQTMAGFFNGGNNTDARLLGGRTELSSTVEVIYEYAQIHKHGSMWDKMDRLLKSDGVDYLFEPTPAYGVSLGWQAQESWKVMGGWSAFYNQAKDKYGEAASRGSALPAKSFYVEDAFLGVKYRKDRWISSLEYHRMKGTATMTKAGADKAGDTTDRFIWTLTWMF